MKIKNDLTYWSFMIDGDTDLSPKKCEIRMLQGRLATTQLKQLREHSVTQQILMNSVFMLKIFTDVNCIIC